MTDYVAGWILPEEGRTRDEAAHELMTKLAELLPAGPGDRLVTEGYFDPAAEAYRIVLHRIPAPVVREESPEEADARLRLALEEAIASPGGRAVAEAILERKKLADALTGRSHWLEGGSAGLMEPVELPGRTVDSVEEFAAEIVDRGREILHGKPPIGRTSGLEARVEAAAAAATAPGILSGMLGLDEPRPVNGNKGYPTLAELRGQLAGRTADAGVNVEDLIDREIDNAIGRGEI